MDEAKKMHIETENLAVPEIEFDENRDEDLDENVEEPEIDFSGAIPQIHFKQKED